MENSSLVEQGIAAYKAGNKEEAIQLLGQAIRDDRDNEEAWLYLGAALDDVNKKRQAFTRVLQINPNNEKAKNALARLDLAAGGATPAGAGTGAKSSSAKSASSSNQSSSAGSPPPADDEPAYTGPGRFSTMYNEGVSLPFKVDGSPSVLTGPYIVETARKRIEQAIQIYSKQDFEAYVEMAQGARLWDAVFIAATGAIAAGVAEMLGRLIGWPLNRFFLGVGGLLGALFGGIIAIVATGAGFAAAVYASQYYLKNQGIKVSLPQHAMYYALVWFPMTLISAVISFITNSVGILIACIIFPLFLVIILLLFYNWFLLKGAFERVYGTEDNRGLITAIIAVVAGAVGSGLVRLIFNPIFRLP